MTKHRTTWQHVSGFNSAVALKITNIVGSMWCAYIFTLLSLISLPAVLTQVAHLHFFPSWLISVSLIGLVAWIAQTFLQLVLLPIIMVGQNVQNIASDARAQRTFDDAEVIADRLDLDTQGGLQTILQAIEDTRCKCTQGTS